MFSAACKKLRQTGDSACLSPEGERHRGDQLGLFNKGAFHLATALQVSIVPLYIYYPPSMQAGRNFHALSGSIDVHVLPSIDTSGWSVENIDRHRDEVRTNLLRQEAEIKSAVAARRPVNEEAGSK